MPVVYPVFGHIEEDRCALKVEVKRWLACSFEFACGEVGWIREASSRVGESPCPRHLHRPWRPHRSPPALCVHVHRHTMVGQHQTIGAQAFRLLTYWNLPMVSLISPDEYSYSFLL